MASSPGPAAARPADSRPAEYRPPPPGRLLAPPGVRPQNRPTAWALAADQRPPAQPSGPRLWPTTDYRPSAVGHRPPNPGALAPRPRPPPHADMGLCTRIDWRRPTATQTTNIDEPP
ncbi:hypothetical protein GCM10010508_32780 [Streptomyces naganishii JCM 4654]|uniref:Uncharacterized protein n=1 Tax=Streptomyces naganishii JCM 4654 TaxID=1306179 RepID=A0A918Y3J9_9ACTN|nr:hypothetical protein GCM10010508_32780 [Streptomyces naganishii JCM 4654]